LMKYLRGPRLFPSIRLTFAIFLNLPGRFRDGRVAVLVLHIVLHIDALTIPVNAVSA
jgi:hypothetical protein